MNILYVYMPLVSYFYDTYILCFSAQTWQEQKDIHCHLRMKTKMKNTEKRKRLKPRVRIFVDFRQREYWISGGNSYGRTVATLMVQDNDNESLFFMLDLMRNVIHMFILCVYVCVCSFVVFVVC